MTESDVAVTALQNATISATESERVQRFKDEITAVFLQGDYAGAVRRAEAALLDFTECQEQRGQAMALYQLGCAYRHQRNIKASLDALQQSIDLSESLEATRDQAMAVNAMGLTFKHNAEYAESLHCFQRSITLAQQAGDRQVEANGLGNIAAVYSQIGDNAASLEMLYRCLTLFEHLGKEHNAAIALLNIGINYMVLKDARAAIPVLERGLELLEKHGDRYHIASLLDVLGAAHNALENYDTGQGYLYRALYLFEALEMSDLIAMILGRISAVLMTRGRFDEAKAVIERALSINNKAGNRQRYADNLGKLGDLYANQAFPGHNDSIAISLLEEARIISEESNFLTSLCWVYGKMADVYEQRGEFKEALAFHRLFYRTEQRIFNEQSDERVRNLQVRFDVARIQQAAEIARRDAEIAHLRSVELAEALAEAERLRVIADRRAVTDSLTGVLNRRFLDEKLKDEWEKSLLHSHPLTLALIDIDHFKKVNDQFGHDIGDETLRRVAHLLQSGCRSSHDIIARYGGEEFALLLPRTDTASGRALCERIRAIIEVANWDEIADGLRVTISIGISTTGGTSSPSLTQPEGLVKRADQMLYRSKTTGRNRISS